MPTTNINHDPTPDHSPRDYEGLQSADPADPSTGLHLVPDVQPIYYHQQEKFPTQNDDALATEEAAKKIPWFRKPIFWLIVSNIALAIALVVLGALHNRLGKGDQECKNITNSTIPTTNLNTPPICFNTTTHPPLGTPFGNVSPECPLSSNPSSTNSTYYTVPATNLTFSRLCSADYPGNDMARFPVSSMEDCLALCAQLHLFPSSIAGPCVGATWVYDDGGDHAQGTGVSFCFPKSVIGTGVKRPGTESALLVG